MNWPRTSRGLALAASICLLSTSGAVGQEAQDGTGAGDQRSADRSRLLALNEELVRSQIVQRDASFFDRIAVDEFRVLAPGGLIETRAEAIAGVTAWDVTDVQLSGTDIVFHGDVAIMTGRMDIDGTMQPVGRWGPLKYMSTWIKQDGEWRLASRSLTPCLDKLIEIGRC
ncbi:nuclear transport factor 2 family protein [Halomonas denitrificans]|nr:nuclear transport factor 2 family protein [Halomonas denitrificans]